ncbi:ZIP metal ion transporter family isoform X2 [Wolffia australiana]
MNGVAVSQFSFLTILLLSALCSTGDGSAGVCSFSAGNEADQHHPHHHHDHHHHLHGCGDHNPQTQVRKLPEELAEEEDLAQEGFSYVHSSHDHDHHHHYQEELKLSSLGLWAQAMGCSLLVSMASLICLVLLPVFFFKGKPSKLLVDSLAVFGAGAMLGDAFLHQLPHAFGGHSHGHDGDHHENHSHSEPYAVEGSHAHSLKDLSIGISVLGGILLFLLVEKIVRYIEAASGEHNHAPGHGHHHHHHRQKKSEEKSEMSNGSVMTSEIHDKSNKTTKRKLASSSQKGVSSADDGSTNSGKAEEAKSNIVFGYLNLFSDGVHNFTDGMALGSAFLLHGSVGGWATTLFLLAHELPQEIGDFGILVRSGFSVSNALLFNFLSALVALAGTAVALLLGRNPGHSSLIEAFTAGGFIYVSVAGVLPEINSGDSTIKSSIIQISSFVLGMIIALSISLVE